MNSLLRFMAFSCFAEHISGFPELFPEFQEGFHRHLAFLEKIFGNYGFSPLDTASVERLETLMSKGEDKEIYGLCRAMAREGEKKERDFGLRFDLTVSLARYLAQHHNRTIFPYKRYQIGSVWRGERPQKGRYRQFYQCDLDILNKDHHCLGHDAEVLQMAIEALEALDLPPFTIFLNNRKIVQGLLETWGIPQDHHPLFLRAMDKLHKIPLEELLQELQDKGMKAAYRDQWCALTSLSQRPLMEGLETIAKVPSSNLLFRQGLQELQEVVRLVLAFDPGLVSRLKFDPSLARGLAYYTGTVFETRIHDRPDLGSVCGGGQYDHLSHEFGKQALPGVGISLGLTRLLPLLCEQYQSRPTAQVLMTSQSRDCLEDYIALSQTLRRQGFKVLQDLTCRPLAKQLKDGEKRHIPYVLLGNKEEIQAKKIQVKDMARRAQTTLPWDQLGHFLAAGLTPSEKA